MLIPFQTFRILGWSTEHFPQIAFSYAFDDTVQFTETITLPDLPVVAKENVEPYLFSIALALGVSYYALYPYATIHMQCGRLSSDQQEFWHTFYRAGLGEHIYRNQLDYDRIGVFASSEGPIYTKDLSEQSVGHTLLCRGGGKDSIVSAELLKEKGIHPTAWTLGKDFPIHAETAQIAGIPRFLVYRTLDHQITTLKSQGYYHGHVPVTGMMSFVGLLVAKLYGFSNIVVSAEKSANEENVVWQGECINHQWSKSAEFFSLFATYVTKHITGVIHYENLLAERHEWQIAERFARYPAYFTAFSSCNRNFHQDGPRLGSGKRCCICPKCLFVYMILRPFLTEDQVTTIWGKELYQDSSLVPLAEEIRGFSGIKPFECVGSYEESRQMTERFLVTIASEDVRDWPVLQRYQELKNSGK